MERIRISYAKIEALRYAGNLDIHKIWERLFRRAHLPLAYSQGFHPQPRINQAAPLPLGFSSQAEMIDVWLDEDIPLDAVKTALVETAPPGLIIHHIELADMRAPALPTVVRSSEYVATLVDPVEIETLKASVAALLASSEIRRERRGKTYDLRPLIEDITTIVEPGSPVQLFIRLSVREGATGRPDEVLMELGLDASSAQIERTRLLLETPA